MIHNVCSDYVNYANSKGASLNWPLAFGRCQSFLFGCCSSHLSLYIHSNISMQREVGLMCTLSWFYWIVWGVLRPHSIVSHDLLSYTVLHSAIIPGYAWETICKCLTSGTITLAHFTGLDNSDNSATLS